MMRCAACYVCGEQRYTFLFHISCDILHTLRIHGTVSPHHTPVPNRGHLHVQHTSTLCTRDAHVKVSHISSSTQTHNLVPHYLGKRQRNYIPKRTISAPQLIRHCSLWLIVSLSVLTFFMHWSNTLLP